MKRKKFTLQFKLEAVRMMEQENTSPTDLAKITAYGALQ